MVWFFGPKCPKCGTKMEKFVSSGQMIYLCPRRDVHPRHWRRVQPVVTVTRERITEPIKPSRTGELLHAWRKTHPPLSAAEKLKQYAQKARKADVPMRDA